MHPVPVQALQVEPLDCDMLIGGGHGVLQVKDPAGLFPALQVVALDCEMVGVGPGAHRSMLARVCLVNNLGIVLMDELVQPQVGPAQPPRSRHTQSLRSAHMRAHGNRSIVCLGTLFSKPEAASC